MVYFILLPHKEHIISTLLPDPPQEDASRAEALLRQISEALIDPLILVAQVSQLALNYRVKTFAGNHPLTSILLLAVRVLNLLLFVPHAVGRFESRPALTVQDLLDTVRETTSSFWSN